MSGKYWDFGFNWGAGCSWASRGCDRCYALQGAARMVHNPNPKISQRWDRLLEFDGEGKPRWTGRTRFVPEALTAAIRRVKPAVWFTSMFDPFHPGIPDFWRDQALAAMVLCPQHTFIWSTKRPEVASRYFAGKDLQERVRNLLWPTFTAALSGKASSPVNSSKDITLPLRNFILMATVEDQAAFNARWPHLAKCAPWARELALSYEPALGPVDLARCEVEGGTYNALYGTVDVEGRGRRLLPNSPYVCRVFAGGETGQGARPAHPDWFRAVRDQCEEIGVEFHFKSWGEWEPGEKTPKSGTGYVSCATGKMMVGKGEPARENFGTHVDKNSGDMIALRVGSRRSGRLLDGKQYDAKPVAGVGSDDGTSPFRRHHA